MAAQAEQMLREDMGYFLWTERLGFRTWGEADEPLAVALWTDAEVMGHMGGAMSAGEAAARMQVQMEIQRTLGFQYWPMFSLESGAHAGCSGLRPFHDRTDVIEIGVHLARAFWSGRYGEEAARAVIGWAWAHTAAEALVAGHGPRNDHSKALLSRLGFVYTHHEPWGPHGTMHPYYRLERPVGGSVPSHGGRVPSERGRGSMHGRVDSATMPVMGAVAVLVGTGLFSAVRSQTVQGAPPYKGLVLEETEEYPLGIDGTGLLFTGTIGVGKAHLAVGLLRELILSRNATGLFSDYRDLLRQVQNS